MIPPTPTHAHILCDRASRCALFLVHQHAGYVLAADLICFALLIPRQVLIMSLAPTLAQVNTSSPSVPFLFLRRRRTVRTHQMTIHSPLKLPTPAKATPSLLSVVRSAPPTSSPHAQPHHPARHCRPLHWCPTSRSWCWTCRSPTSVQRIRQRRRRRTPTSPS